MSILLLVGLTIVLEQQIAWNGNPCGAFHGRIVVAWGDDDLSLERLSERALILLLTGWLCFKLIVSCSNVLVELCLNIEMIIIKIKLPDVSGRCGGGH